MGNTEICLSPSIRKFDCLRQLTLSNMEPQSQKDGFGDNPASSSITALQHRQPLHRARTRPAARPVAAAASRGATGHVSPPRGHAPPSRGGAMLAQNSGAGCKIPQLRLGYREVMKIRGKWEKSRIRVLSFERV